MLICINAVLLSLRRGKGSHTALKLPCQSLPESLTQFSLHIQLHLPGLYLHYLEQVLHSPFFKKKEWKLITSCQASYAIPGVIPAMCNFKQSTLQLTQSRQLTGGKTKAPSPKPRVLFRWLPPAPLPLSCSQSSQDPWGPPCAPLGHFQGRVQAPPSTSGLPLSPITSFAGPAPVPTVWKRQTPARGSWHPAKATNGKLQQAQAEGSFTELSRTNLNQEKRPPRRLYSCHPPPPHSAGLALTDTCPPC